METETNYFSDRISDEIIVQIFSSIDHHADFTRLAQTCSRFNNLLRDKQFACRIRYPWSSFLSRASLMQFMTDRLRSLVITEVNLTDIYWIPSGLIKDMVLNLTNLKTLLVAGTVLSWTHLAQILNRISLQGLSWSWDNALEDSCRRHSSISPKKFAELTEMQERFLSLKALLVHIPILSKGPTDVLFYTYSALEYMIALCHNLKSLWILSWPKSVAERKISSTSITRGQDDFDFKFELKSLVVSIKEPPRFSNVQFVRRLVRHFEKSPSPAVFWLDHPLVLVRPRSGTVVSLLEDISKPFGRLNGTESLEQLSCPLVMMKQISDANLTPQFDKLRHMYVSQGQPAIVALKGVLDNAPNLESFSCSSFNIKIDWKKFVDHHQKLKSVCLSEAEELEGYCCAISKLSQLEKLSISIECLHEIRDLRILSEYNISQQDKETTTSEVATKNFATSHSYFKRRRVGVSSKPQTTGEIEAIAGVHLIAAGCSNLTELEIGLCGSSKAGRFLQSSLFSISQFKQLTKLSLASLPIISNASFLVSICSHCPLKSLRLTHCGPSAKCIYISDLCRSLKLCKNLKDFRLEQNYIGSPLPILSALQNCPKLQRVLLCSDPNDRPLELQSVDKLFSHCPELVVFYATVETTTKSDCRKIKKELEVKYKPTRPPVSVVVHRSLEEEEVTSYPSVHYRQLVVNTPKVCTTDFCDFDYARFLD